LFVNDLMQQRNRTMKIKLLSLLFALAITLYSCNKFTDDAGIPSFVHIEKISLNTSVGQGSDSANIVDAWVYIDNEFMGAYELPATFPLLLDGKQNLTIRPGIILNGISATRSINPFFEEIPVTVDLIPDSTVNLNLQTTYVPEAKFAWNSIGQEDFEQGGISIDSLTASSTSMVKTNVEVYEGDYSGWVHLDKDHPDFIGASTTDFPIPVNKSALVMEINIKNPESTAVIGLYFNLPGGTVIKEEHLYVNPGENWKKLYVNFTDYMSQYSTAISYKVFFSYTLPTDATEANMYVDNIKLIHY
jgi:hypothetical protein